MPVWQVIIHPSSSLTSESSSFKGKWVQPHGYRLHQASFATQNSQMSQSTMANAQRKSWYVQKQACLWQRHVVCSGKAVSYLHRIWNVLRLPDLLWDSNEKIAPKKSLADLSYHLNCHNLPYCMLAHPVPTNCRLLTETTDKQIWHMINGNICRCIKQWETETQWSRLRFADPSLCWKPSRALVHLKNLKTSHICLTEVGSKSIQLTHNYSIN